MLIMTDPPVITQFCQPDHLFPKHPGVKQFMYPMTGGYDLSWLDGAAWKLWRRLFNPGFSARHMLTLKMTEYARKDEIFLFEEHALSVTIDVIGKVALDLDLNPEQVYKEMTSALLAQRQWAAFGLETDFFKVINPMRYFHIWNNTRKMDSQKSKTTIELALNGYATESDTSRDRKPSIDATFRKYASNQMKAFIFTGHDVTASTILAKLRVEHDDILGFGKSKAAVALIENPARLNKLPYILAVINETSRLFSVVSSPRIGRGEFILTDSQGQWFPTENCPVWANHHGLHHNPFWWSQTAEFIPERFLTEEDDGALPAELRPIKNTWRPFEFGPRACIRTELALTKIKVVLALKARDFDLEKVYAEWDKSHKTKGVKTVDGENVYQIS
ncbi:cytochrome P450 [Zopfia rhizophila CBS 207.26]|uniref:Cytochrome P450 n=1 Tax=Zopfia rhizophila CBS 207.26 TaxID=1314779 RepID=A0A6A6DT39_9PEZI|nr:cytochrome P450 [Zopfia rhizophila CBS 207.26]